jgi:hypothetical protein
MKTLMHLCSILLCFSIIWVGCSPKKKLKYVTSVLHLDSISTANTPEAPGDSAQLKSVDRAAQELPHLFKSRTQKVLETKGYQMMSCCSCRSGSGCCTCPQEDISSSLQFAAPADYKKAYLIPATSGKSSIPLTPEESDDLTIFTLDQQVEDGSYTFELQGRRVISIAVTVEEGTLRVAKTNNR